MALKTFVKVGNVSNLSDARYCAGMEVNLLGFRFDADNGMDPETFNEISGWLSGMSYVAEFDTTSPNDIIKVIASCDTDFIQVKNPDWVAELSALKKIILELDLENIDTLPANMPLAYVIISGTKKEFSVTEAGKIQELAGRYNVLIGTGFTPENVESVIRELGVRGIAMKGSEEIRPGYKDYDELADILEILEVED